MKKISLFILFFLVHLGYSQGQATRGAAVNIVNNGQFNDGLNAWSNFVANWIPVTATFAPTNNEANITGITGAGGATWHVQLNQVLSPAQIGMLTTGQTYRISFSARSAADNRPVKLFFGEDGGGFAAVHQQDFMVSTTMTSYQTSVFTVNATYGAMKLGFEMGLNNADVFIDNVVLEQFTAPPPPLTLLQNFEAGGLGATFGGASAALEPSPAGPASLVARLTQNAGQVWQGVNMSFTQNVELTTNKTMQMDVYSLTPISIAPKVINGVAGAPDSTTSASHGGTGWETLSFTFNQGLDSTVTANGVYAGFVIYYNWNTATNNFGTPDGRVFYVDNLRGTPAPVAPPVPTPTEAAPTPPARPVADVISIFSEAYTNVPVTTWGPNWGPSSAPIVDFPISGNATKRINMGANQTFAGIDFAANKFNATEFTHFHLDYWTPAPLNVGQVISIKLSNHAGAMETSAVEFVVTAPTTNGWVPIDIPLTSFNVVNTNANRDNIAQIIISAARAIGSNPVTIYFDNVYFYKNPIVPPPPATVPLVAAPTPPNRPMADVVSIFSDAYTSIPVQTWGPNWGASSTPITDSPVAGNPTKLISMGAGQTFAGIDFAPNKFNATDFTHFHLDYWTPAPLNVGQVISIKLSNHDGPGETSAIEYVVTSPTASQWVQIDVPLSSFNVVNSNASRNNIAQIIISAARANGANPVTLYIDNVYFHKNTLVLPPASQIRPSQCGLHLAPNNPTVLLNAVPVAGATNYNFEVVINGGAPQVISTTNPFFNFGQLNSLPSASSVINIRVRNEVGGLWSAYGNVCTVYTRTQITAVRASQCGLVLPAFNGGVVINAIPVNAASSYEFQVTVNNGNPQIVNSATSMFSFSQLSALPGYSSTISIRARAIVNTVPGAWGLPCQVTTVTQITQLLLSQCGLQLIPANESTVVLNAIPVDNATNYEFLVTVNNGTPQSINTANSFFNFGQLNALPNPGTEIFVSVRATVNGIVGAFGRTCLITTAGAVPTLLNSNTGGIQVYDNQEVMAYPNPFSSEFTVRLANNSEANIQIFDINGRLVANQMVQDSYEVALGQNLTSGVYLVRVEQNNEAKSFKLIKK